MNNNNGCKILIYALFSAISIVASVYYQTGKKVVHTKNKKINIFVALPTKDSLEFEYNSLPFFLIYL